jgi:hypothetical protein
MTSSLQTKQTELKSQDVQELTLSLLFPFEPKINAKSHIEATLKDLLEEAESRVFQQMPKQQARLVLAQVKQMVGGLDFGTHKRSVVLTATPHSGKVYYWNIPVQKTILISREFPVRELLAKKKVEKNYLLLAMGENVAGIYLGSGTKLSRLVANSPAPPFQSRIKNDGCQSDLQRSVIHIDAALSILLRSYGYPVFVVAPSKTIQCFRQLSRNVPAIAAFIEKSSDCSSFSLQKLMAPHLADWQSLKEKLLLQQLEQTQQVGKLAVGISEVWHAASERRGRLMVVEDEYVFPAYLDQNAGIFYADAIPIDTATHPATDAVCDAIIKVLADGGIVEVVAKGTMSEYMHVAMVCF